MKKILFGLLHRTGVTRFAAWRNRKRVIFLCYHGVTERLTRAPEDSKALQVNRQRFATHLDFLARRYHPISLRDYLTARDTGQCLRDYSVILTFDDGFRNFLTVAAPLLVERNIPATVFLITDKVAQENGEGESSWSPEDDQKSLSWAEARMLKEQYRFEFGSHTCSHSRLLGLSLLTGPHCPILKVNIRSCLPPKLKRWAMPARLPLIAVITKWIMIPSPWDAP
jgi:peptidoglycan/xylan/chitin deacetylase (PgdA/CDA1 family)